MLNGSHLGKKGDPRAPSLSDGSAFGIFARGPRRHADLELPVKGFSLVEVMVSVAIIGVISATVMVVSSSGIKLSIDSKTSIENQAVTDQISELISNEQSCRLALGGPDTIIGALGPEAQIINLTAPTNIKLYKSMPSPRTKFVDPADPSFNRFGASTLTTLTLEPLDPSGFANGVNKPAKITVTFNSSLNTPKVTSNLYLSVRVNAAKQLVTCSRFTYSTDGNYANKCDGAYNGYVSTGTQLNCRQVRCPVGVPCGLLPTGNVKCQATCP